ncbi:uncharacterized protein LOC117650688 [Thrips palmi]|uniref:Uncharacterized protein LOC117650688 n=1 Tax=Thrips palmi TaxID=161013 RepID=A0A6P8ZXL4_THRPL|nr:uncharacterized protein LOC117650688 [Thrips palmi]
MSQVKPTAGLGFGVLENNGHTVSNSFARNGATILRIVPPNASMLSNKLCPIPIVKKNVTPMCVNKVSKLNIIDPTGLKIVPYSASSYIEQRTMQAVPKAVPCTSKVHSSERKPTTVPPKLLIGSNVVSANHFVMPQGQRPAAQGQKLATVQGQKLVTAQGQTFVTAQGQKFVTVQGQKLVAQGQKRLAVLEDVTNKVSNHSSEKPITVQPKIEFLSKVVSSRRIFSKGRWGPMYHGVP